MNSIARQSKWSDDPAAAALAWSRLTEPSDRTAARVRAHFGVQEALARVVDGGPLPLCGAEGHEHHDGCPPQPTRPARARELREGLERWRSRLPALDPGRDLDRAARVGARLLVREDPQWPPGLDDLYEHAPVLLWVRGSLHRGRAVAVVGSRHCTGYGRRIAADLGAGLASRDHDVVSGAALGIDGSAHRGALTAGGHTTAVLACGIDRAYPAAHTDLIEQVAATGAVISESPPGSDPTRWRFLERNRLIAALATSTVVVEAALRSGALSTVGHAHKLHRPVGAVPGPVTSAASAGNHQLIRDQQAILVTGVDEVVELTSRIGELDVPEPRLPVLPQDGLDPLQLRVWETLSPRRSLTLPQLTVGAGVCAAQVRVALGVLAAGGLAIRGRDPQGTITWRRG